MIRLSPKFENFNGCFSQNNFCGIAFNDNESEVCDPGFAGTRAAANPPRGRQFNSILLSFVIGMVWVLNSLPVARSRLVLAVQAADVPGVVFTAGDDYALAGEAVDKTGVVPCDGYGHEKLALRCGKRIEARRPVGKVL